MNSVARLLYCSGFLSFLVTNDLASSVNFPSGNASWTVEMKSLPAGSPPPAIRVPEPHVQNVEVVQVDNVKRTVITWSDGKSSEKWSLPGLPVVFEEDPRNGMVAPFQNGSMREIFNDFYLTYDSFAFDWVAPQYLQEKTPVTYEGKDCYHYMGSFAPPMQKFTIKKEAWIDAKTSLPAALANGFNLSVFKFSDKPPVGPLDLPANFKKAVNYYKVSVGYP